MFPMKINHESGSKFTIKNIDEYRNNFQAQGDRHSFRAKLVAARCAEISIHFKWLRDLSNTARYIDYSFAKPSEVLSEAKKHLAEISEFCGK
jgi:hypothetical protein